MNNMTPPALHAIEIRLIKNNQIKIHLMKDFTFIHHISIHTDGNI